MTAPSHTAVRPSTTQTFGALHIDRRVLRTVSRTIVIANVATVSIGTHVEHRPRWLLWLGVLVLGLIAYGATQAGVAAQGKLNLVSAALGLAGVVLALSALKPDDKTHYLLISSTDGVMTRFAASDRTVLEEVRRLLTDKINAANEAAVFSINFETGVIENLSITSGSGHLATGHAKGSGAANAAYGGRTSAASAETALSSPRSGAVPSAAVSQLNGAGGAIAEIYVDFRAVLPAIVEMQRFYARQPNAQHLEHRLSELELLMRAGAQTQGQKSRVRDLTKDLSHILQSYQPAVQIFQQISGMAA